MHTNNPPAGAFRGFGVMQSAFAVESMMDMLAEALQIDPITLRRMNALRVGSHTNTGQELTESVGLLACIDAVQEKLYALAGPEPFKPVIKKTDKGNVISAWGFAVAFKNTGLGGSMPDQSGAEVELFTDGTLQVRTSAAELGQGLVTVLQMIVAEEFSISIDKVRVLVMDTDRTPDGGPTTASRQTYVTGNAARHAAFKLQEEIRRYLQAVHAEDPESIRFADGFVIGEDLRKALGDIAQEMQTQGYTTSAKVTYTAPKTHDLKESGNIHFAYSFACQAAQVEVNPESGEVRVLRVICANDVGKAINPMGLKGQVEGGIIMGIGHTLMEEFIVENGHIQTRRLSDYPIPTIQDTPEIIAMIVETPTSEGPYGAKGVGEIVSIPTTPAITNAIYHAVGVRIDHLPVRKSDICQKHNCE
jgi:xanthine dehydrogenase molybdenum-binding subunit